jgi:hypothetical protein
MPVGFEATGAAEAEIVAILALIDARDATCYERANALTQGRSSRRPNGPGISNRDRDELWRRIGAAFP